MAFKDISIEVKVTIVSTIVAVASLGYSVYTTRRTSVERFSKMEGVVEQLQKTVNNIEMVQLMNAQLIKRSVKRIDDTEETATNLKKSLVKTKKEVKAVKEYILPE